MLLNRTFQHRLVAFYPPDTAPGVHTPGRFFVTALVPMADYSEFSRFAIAALPSVIAGFSAWIGASFFSIKSQRKTSLYNEKLARYVAALKALHTLSMYLSNLDETSSDGLISKAEKDSARASILWLVGEQNFVLSAESAEIIAEFAQFCPLLWPGKFDGPESEFIRRSLDVCKYTVKELVISGKRDVGWKKEKMLDDE